MTSDMIEILMILRVTVAQVSNGQFCAVYMYFTILMFFVFFPGGESYKVNTTCKCFCTIHVEQMADAYLNIFLS